MSAFPNAFDSAFETEQSGVVASVLNAFEEAYSRLFQVATWILPIWITRSEFVFVLVTVGVLLAWTVGELALVVPSERIVPSIPSDVRTSAEVGASVLGVSVGGALMFLTLLERLPTGNLLGVGFSLVVLGISNLDRTGRVPHRLSISLKMGTRGCLDRTRGWSRLRGCERTTGHVSLPWTGGPASGRKLRTLASK